MQYLQTTSNYWCMYVNFNCCSFFCNQDLLVYTLQLFFVLLCIFLKMSQMEPLYYKNMVSFWQLQCKERFINICCSFVSLIIIDLQQCVYTCMSYCIYSFIQLHIIHFNKCYSFYNLAFVLIWWSILDIQSQQRLVDIHLSIWYMVYTLIG